MIGNIERGAPPQTPPHHLRVRVIIEYPSQMTSDKSRHWYFIGYMPTNRLLIPRYLPSVMLTIIT